MEHICFVLLIGWVKCNRSAGLLNRNPPGWIIRPQELLLSFVAYVNLAMSYYLLYIWKVLFKIAEPVFRSKVSLVFDFLIFDAHGRETVLCLALKTLKEKGCYICFQGRNEEDAFSAASQWTLGRAFPSCSVPSPLPFPPACSKGRWGTGEGRKIAEMQCLWDLERRTSSRENQGSPEAISGWCRVARQPGKKWHL